MLISQIPTNSAAFSLANDIRQAPVTAGATRTTMANDRGTLLSMNQVAARDDMMLTAPEGMFNKAACLGVYPNPAISTAEKLVTAPLWRTQHPQIRKISQIVMSERNVEITCEIRKRLVVTEYLFSTRSL